jgi:DNA-directed RNA polymerase subunit RPC12/RpoP
MTSPIVIRCARCGHSAIPRGRVADLAGRVLKCTQCGTRQRIDLAQIIEATYREDRTAKGSAANPTPSRTWR